MTAQPRLRLLVVEGNLPELRASERAASGVTPSEAYAHCLAALAPDALIDIIAPGDDGAALPAGVDLAAYDGVALTGSAMHIYEVNTAIERQIAFLRAVFAAGAPVFGSCWGLQIATVAAGGSVRRNPRGREIGISRDLQPTEAGRESALLRGRPAAFQALTTHLDEVEALPEGAVLLASNAVSAVQAAAFTAGGSEVWAVQYHPEFTFAELAGIMRRRRAALVAEGFYGDEEAALAHIADLARFDADAPPALAWRYGYGPSVVDPAARRLELVNWLSGPVAARRISSSAASSR